MPKKKPTTAAPHVSGELYGQLTFVTTLHVVLPPPEAANGDQLYASTPGVAWGGVDVPVTLFTISHITRDEASRVSARFRAENGSELTKIVRATWHGPEEM